MIANGMVRRGLGVSSAMVDTASKPRNDRHSTAAPAMISGALKPSWWNGASSDTGADCSLRVCTDNATNTTMNTN